MYRNRRNVFLLQLNMLNVVLSPELSDFCVTRQWKHQFSDTERKSSTNMKRYLRGYKANIFVITSGMMLIHS